MTKDQGLVSKYEDFGNGAVQPPWQLQKKGAEAENETRENRQIKPGDFQPSLRDFNHVR
jgi:hypothetical protein